MHPVVNTNDAESSGHTGFAYAYARQREIGTAARGATALSTTAERDHAFAAFVRHDVLQLDVYQRWGVTFATTLHRGGAKGFTLHMDSDSPEFPNERHDLSQGEVDAWCAERDAEPVSAGTDWPVVKPWAALDVPAYTVNALAKRWGCSAGVVSLLIVTGELPAYKVGKRRRLVSADQVAEFERRPAVQSKEYAKAVSAMEHLPAAEVVPVVVLPPPTPLKRDIYSVKQLAERWGNSECAIRRAIRRGELSAFRTYGGRLLRVQADAVHIYELSRLPEVVSAEERAAKAEADRQYKEAMNASRVRRRAAQRFRAQREATEAAPPVPSATPTKPRRE